MSEPDTGQVPSTKPRHIAQRTKFGWVCFAIYWLIFLLVVIGTVSDNPPLPSEKYYTASAMSMIVAAQFLLFLVPYWLLMWLIYYSPGWVRKWSAVITSILLIFSGGE